MDEAIWGGCIQGQLLAALLEFSSVDGLIPFCRCAIKSNSG
jgi:hypothetical protein